MSSLHYPEKRPSAALPGAAPGLAGDDVVSDLPEPCNRRAGPVAWITGA